MCMENFESPYLVFQVFFKVPNNEVSHSFGQSANLKSSVAVGSALAMKHPVPVNWPEN